MRFEACPARRGLVAQTAAPHLSSFGRPCLVRKRTALFGLRLRARPRLRGFVGCPAERGQPKNSPYTSSVCVALGGGGFYAGPAVRFLLSPFASSLVVPCRPQLTAIRAGCRAPRGVLRMSADRNPLQIMLAIAQFLSTVMSQVPPPFSPPPEPLSRRVRVGFAVLLLQSATLVFFY